MNVANVADLAKLRHVVGRLAHDEEHLSGCIVTLYRSTALLRRIICATLDLARTAEQICAGIRFRRSNAADWAASELALAA